MEDSLFLIFFLVVFPLFWLAVTALISFVGGWHSLAEIYGSDTNPAERVKTFTMQSMRLGGFTSYSSCLKITLFKSGLELRTIFIFAFMHKPLFIPWEDLKVVGYSGIFNNRLKARVAGREITLYGRAVRYLRDEGFAK